MSVLDRTAPLPGDARDVHRLRGDVAPQTVDVAGVTGQWGGSVQY
ncbi:hypothetical protein [Nocardia terpenica]|nr:hypothetical protein [Nocardia terpenica]